MHEVQILRTQFMGFPFDCTQSAFHIRPWSVNTKSASFQKGSTAFPCSPLALLSSPPAEFRAPGGSGEMVVTVRGGASVPQQMCFASCLAILTSELYSTMREENIF